MDDATQKNEILEKKARYYSENKTVVHITYSNGNWVRGKIAEVSNEFFFLDENLQGRMMIFFAEIDRIDVYFKKNKEGTNHG